MTLKINCIKPCVENILEVYGQDVYGQKSKVCAAAYHAGVIPGGGGSFEMMFIRP